MRSSHVPAHATYLIRKIGAIIRGRHVREVVGRARSSWEATALSEEVFVETCCGMVVEIRWKRGRRRRKDERGGEGGFRKE
jgi:hypothetical protein